MEFRVHWLSITIWGTYRYGLEMWDVWFKEYLGEMQSTGHGGRGFYKIFKALASSRLYGDPPKGQEGEWRREYFNIELPGQACDAIPIQLLKEFLMDLMLHEEFKVKRIDLAWDKVPFTPSDVNSAIETQNTRTLARRKTLNFTSSKFEERDDGAIGTSSCKLGARSSTRMLRVYDKRGPTRIEFVAKDDRAHQIAKQLLNKHVDVWSKVAKSHLRDYIDFIDKETEEFLHWWWLFIQEVERANTKVNKTRELELERILNWLRKQAAPSLSVVADTYGHQIIEEIIQDGRLKRGNRFRSIMEAHKPGGENYAV